MSDRVRAAVAGANGYAGMTLVHLLARHSGVELVQLTSRSYAGKPYSEVFPLHGMDGAFQEEADAASVDVVFSCLPHHVGAGKAAGWLAAGARVVDMSADFRLRDLAQYPLWYKQEHPAPELLAKAVFGLPELHAGELPGAAGIVGVSVKRVGYAAVALSGMLAGLGGGYLALDQHQFTDQMTAGRGFIAISAVIFRRWDPIRAALACLLFAAAETLQIQLQGSHAIASQFIEMIPYALTIVALAGVVGRAVPPAALGKVED